MKRFASVATAVCAAAALTGCGDTSAPPSGAPAGVAAGMYERYPECGDPPEGIEHEPVEGLVLPPGSVVTAVNTQGPITQVSAWVQMTPVDVRAVLTDTAAIDIINAEDEGFEAELVAGSGARRMYVKALAACRDASTLVVFISPASDATALPGLGS